MHEYKTARTIFNILEFVAWAFVAIGVIFAVAGASAATGFSGRSAGLMGAIPGVIMAFVGIVAVATVQFYRAGVDTAEMTGKMLQISKEQLQLAKQTYAATAPARAAPIKQAGEPNRANEPPPATFAPPPSKAPEKPQTLAEPKAPAVSRNIADGTMIEYKGKEIHLSGQKAVIGAMSFASVDAARRHIDRLDDRDGAEQLVLKHEDRSTKPMTLRAPGKLDR